MDYVSECWNEACGNYRKSVFERVEHCAECGRPMIVNSSGVRRVSKNKGPRKRGTKYISK